MVAYNIQWYDKLSDFPDFLTEEDIKEFWEIFQEILSNIDDEVINDFRIIKKSHVRYFLMYLKNEKDFHIDTVNDCGEIQLMTGDFTINYLHNHRIYLDIIGIEDGVLRISGTFTSSCDYNTLRFEAIKTSVNGKKQVFKESEEFFRNNSTVRRFLGIDWHFKRCFHFEIPIDDEESNLELKIVYHENDDEVLMSNEIKFREECLLSDLINYFAADSYIMLFEKNSFNLYPYSIEKATELKNELLQYIHGLLESEKNLKRENKSLNIKINKLDRKNRILHYRNNELKDKNKKLRQKNKEIMNSTSWKVTKPLRMPKQFIEKR